MDLDRETPRPLLWSLTLYIISLPFFNFSLINITWQGTGIVRLDWLAGIILILVFVVYLLFGSAKIYKNPLTFLVLLNLLIGFASGINLLNKDQIQIIDYLTKAVQLLFVTLIYFVITNLPLNETERKRVLKVWFLVTLAVALFGIYQLFARLYNLPFAYLIPSASPLGVQSGRFYVAGESTVYNLMDLADLSRASFVQVSSIFKEPTYLGSYLLPPLFFFGYLLLKNQSEEILFRSRTLNILLYLPLLVCFIFSLSLGPIVSAGVALILFLVFRQWKITGKIQSRAVPLLILLFFVVFIGLSVSGVIPVLFLRLQSLAGDLISAGQGGGTSLGIRLERSLAALRVWVEHPILGVGLNNTKYYSEFRSINSGWVQLLSAEGILGFLTMVLIIIFQVLNLQKLARHPRTSFLMTSILTGLIYVIIVEAIDTVITFNWTDPLRWFSLSLASLFFVREINQQQDCTRS